MSIIIDLTRHSAAYGARLLAEAGHEVIRVEPRSGDMLRRLGPHVEDHLDLEHGPYHMFLNMGKKSVTLDLTSPEGREVFLKLIETADALIANAPLPIEEKLLRQRNSRLALILLEDELPEICAYARSGLMSITGQPSQRPVLAGGHVSYAITGLYVAIAAAAAINAQHSTGQGEVVRVSAHQSLESLMEQAVIAYTTSGEITRRRGLRGQITAISGALECADGYWMVSVPPNPQAWNQMKEWVADPALLNDATLDDEVGRHRKRDFILDRLEAWSKQWPKEHLVTGAQSRGIAASPVATPAELVRDPQLLECGFSTAIEDAALGSIALPGGAISTTRAVPLNRAPLLGEHNVEILSRLGYSKLEQQTMMENGVL
jgi:crotonobetainyl-CoA:carnitine CoA-transferase CaiB-like acyl-CoA transferase